ncbi:MAG: glycosyltransferase family 4 protein [Elusimicrobia bacterium]|nr:glycosyltransferase family 4 protein [Elusimicrobiota bacterium]
MRIAQVAPLHESVPPTGYGGTERVVSYLTEELVRLGHEVTLFASSDSRTRARLVSGRMKALRLNGKTRAALPLHLVLLERVADLARDFDFIHFHLDYLPFPLARRLGVPCLSTLHGRLDYPELQPIFSEFRELPLVSISDSQRAPLAFANWAATVYHGLPPGLLTRPEGPPGEHLVFLGRISPEKRVDRAIEIARRSGRRLKIAAKIDPSERGYFKREIAGLLRQPHVDFVGEIGEAEKARFLGEAYALLHPIDWPEPFGLAIIEAMACGTPSVVFDRGSMPELVENGVTGYVVSDVDAAVEALGRLRRFDRARCRERFERRFTAGRMAEDYLSLYRSSVEAVA